MDTQIHTYNDAADLKARITEQIKELATATDAARLTEEMVNYLDTCAKFHRYSLFNVFQILVTRPDATTVAGFKKWQSLGRFVRKGEHGIPILAPIFKKVMDDDEIEQDKLVGFKVVFVFDVAQTEGQPLPEPPNWESPQQDAVLQDRLTQLATSRGIRVKLQSLPNNTQGVSLGGLILLSPFAGTKTLIHELAHELIHQREDAPKEKHIRELEAEAVAFVVGRHFGLDGLASPNYVALYGVTADLIMAHLERIRTTAAEIITALEKDPNN